MLFVIVLMSLSGAVLGMRFKSLILIPILTIALLIIVGAGVTRGDSGPEILLSAIMAATSLQLGYVSASLLRHRTGSKRPLSPDFSANPHQGC